MNPAILVVLIVVGTALLLTAVLVPLFVNLRRSSRRWVDAVQAEMVLTGEHVLLGPAPGSYRGGSGRYSAVGGNAVLLLTDRRLLMRKVTGGVVEVPRARIVSIHEAPSFQGSRVMGRPVLVIVTDEPGTAGCSVADLPTWHRALEPRDRA